MSRLLIVQLFVQPHRSSKLHRPARGSLSLSGLTSCYVGLKQSLCGVEGIAKGEGEMEKLGRGGDEGEEKWGESWELKQQNFVLHTFRSLNVILFKTGLLHESYFYSVGSLPIAEPVFVNFHFQVERVPKHVCSAAFSLVNVLLAQSSASGSCRRDATLMDDECNQTGKAWKTPHRLLWGFHVVYHHVCVLCWFYNTLEKAPVDLFLSCFLHVWCSDLIWK